MIRNRVLKLFGKSKATIISGLPEFIVESLEVDLQTLMQLEDDVDLIMYEKKLFKITEQELLKFKTGFKICDKKINEGFIIDVLNMKGIKGVLMLHKGKYIGFIFWLKRGDEIEIELLCAKKRPETLKKFSVGRTLVKIMENDAKRDGVDIIKLNAVDGAIKFYESIGFKKGKKDSDQLTFMAKSLSGVEINLDEDEEEESEDLTMEQLIQQLAQNGIDDNSSDESDDDELLITPAMMKKIRKDIKRNTIR